MKIACWIFFFQNLISSVIVIFFFLNFQKFLLHFQLYIDKPTPMLSNFQVCISQLISKQPDIYSYCLLSITPQLQGKADQISILFTWQGCNSDFAEFLHYDYCIFYVYVVEIEKYILS